MAADQTRRAIRYPAELKVTCKWAQGEKEVRTVNVSAGGLLVTSDEPLAPGTVLRLTLSLPGGRDATLSAMVRHSSKERGTGVEFMQVMPREQARLNEYLAYLETHCRTQAGGGPA